MATIHDLTAVGLTARGGDLAPGIRVVVDQRGLLGGPSTSASTAGADRPPGTEGHR